MTKDTHVRKEERENERRIRISETIKAARENVAKVLRRKHQSL